MLQKYSRVAQNLPLSPGEFEFSEFSEDEEYPNDAEGREIQKQDLTTRPWLDQENNNRSGSNKKCRICFYGLIAICCTSGVLQFPDGICKFNWSILSFRDEMRPHSLHCVEITKVDS